MRSLVEIIKPPKTHERFLEPKITPVTGEGGFLVGVTFPRKINSEYYERNKDKINEIIEKLGGSINEPYPDGHYATINGDFSVYLTIEHLGYISSLLRKMIRPQDNNINSFWQNLSERKKVNLKLTTFSYLFIEGGIDKSEAEVNADTQPDNFYNAINMIEKHDDEFLNEFHTFQSIYEKMRILGEEQMIRENLPKFAEYLLDTYPELEREGVENFLEKIMDKRKDWPREIRKFLKSKKIEGLVPELKENEAHLPVPYSYKWFEMKTKEVEILPITSFSYQIPGLEKTDATVVELKSYKSFIEETKVLGHCIGRNGNREYYNRSKAGTHRYFSIRNKLGTPEWTIEYEIKTGNVLQFKGGGDRPVNSKPTNSTFPLSTFSALEQVGITINKVSERLEYDIYVENNIFKGADKISLEDLKAHSEWKVISSKPFVVPGNIPESELNMLLNIEGITLDLTLLATEKKEKIKQVKCSLYDNSVVCNYKNLTSCGASISMPNAKSVEQLKMLNKIDGDFIFLSLEKSEGLDNLEIVTGDLLLPSIKETKHLSKLKKVGRSANLSRITLSTGLEHLEEIGFNLFTSEMTSAEGLRSLKKVGGEAYFNKLKADSGLDSLEEIGKGVYFNSLLETSNLRKLSRIGGIAYFRNLQSAKGLISLHTIIGNANFNSLTKSEGLENLQHIKGERNFTNLSREEKHKIPALRLK